MCITLADWGVSSTTLAHRSIYEIVILDDIFFACIVFVGDANARIIGVRTSLDPQHAAWLGGTIVASLSTYPAQAMTKQLYDEEGPRIVSWYAF